eukprot:tig00001067_g6772.t1
MDVGVVPVAGGAEHSVGVRQETGDGTRRAFIFLDPLSQDPELIARCVARGDIAVALILHRLESHWGQEGPLDIDAVLQWFKTWEPRFSHVLGATSVALAVDQLQALAITENIRYVGCASIDNDAGQDTCDLIAATLGLPHNTLHQFRARRNKLAMKVAAMAAGLRCARFSVCRSQLDVAAALAKHEDRWPIVVKTPAGAGTVQVKICRSRAEVESAVGNVLNTPDWFKRRAPYALVEEYLPGTEFAVNMMCTPDHGTHVTDIWRYTKREDAGVPVYQRAELCDCTDGERFGRLAEYGRAVAGAVGMRVGPCHLECKVSEAGEPVMLEVAARFSGGYKPALAAFVTSWDPFLAALDVFEGREPKLPASFKPRAHVFHVFCSVSRGGLVQRIRGLQEITRLPSYHGHMLYAEAGAALQPTTDLFTHPLSVFLVHRERDQLLLDESRVHNLFRIQFADEAATPVMAPVPPLVSLLPASADGVRAQRPRLCTDSPFEVPMLPEAAAVSTVRRVASATETAGLANLGAATPERERPPRAKREAGARSATSRLIEGIRRERRDSELESLSFHSRSIAMARPASAQVLTSSYNSSASGPASASVSPSMGSLSPPENPGAAARGPPEAPDTVMLDAEPAPPPLA